MPDKGIREPARRKSESSLREFAIRVVLGGTLEDKLGRPPGDLDDAHPGPPRRVDGPGRPPSLAISGTPVKVPSAEGMADPAQRTRLIHAFANHELQAVELFGWALLAFPAAPADFRQGLLRILAEEQTHVRMYLGRLEELGVEFGAYPLNGYFWGKVRDLETPAQFVCAMGLTFENANLDHTRHYAAAARAAGDERTARIIDQIHDDEVGHVRFGWEWLGKLTDGGDSMWARYRDNVRWPLRAALARGRDFDVESRRLAGLDEDFIARLEAAERGECD